MKKIRYKDLSSWLRVAIIAGIISFFYYAVLAFFFVAGVIIGIAETV